MREFDEVFSRNILTWGEEKQQQLAEACILVAGVGGLGCTVAEILVRSGVGKLIIIDNGIIDEPDLNRQILYTRDDLGKAKVDVAAEKLSRIHAQSTIIPVNSRIIADPALLNRLWHYNFHGIADCLDNFSSRFILEGLLKEGMFLVHGGVQNDYGQITTIKKHTTKTLKALYPNVEDAGSPLPVCPQIVSCVGSMMASEIVYNLWNTPQLLNILFIIELSDFTFSKIQLH
jgi:molybdopterin/thiamine biosynthesis adenylyltransferase